MFQDGGKQALAKEIKQQDTGARELEAENRRLDELVPDLVH